MPDQSTVKKQPSGSARRRARVAQGLPKYSLAEAAGKKANDLRRAKRRWAEYSVRMDAIKTERGCADCGYNSHPEALHFDHLPGAIKYQQLSRLYGLSWAKVRAEMAKCEVVCANCHAVRTKNRRLADEAEAAKAAREARARLMPFATD